MVHGGTVLAARITHAARVRAGGRRQAAAVIAALALGDVAYRVLLRAQVRRALGMP